MKDYIPKIFKAIVLQVVSLILLIGTVAFATVYWPSSTPDGEIVGGKFMTYFNNIKGDCGTGEVIKGFNNDFTKNCVSLEMPLLCGIDEYESIPGICSIVGTGYYSPTDNNTRYSCTNKPINSDYTTDGNGINNCSYSCTGGYTGTNCENVPITDWRLIDPNCDLPDVQIGTQTWAGCNSTLGTGREFVSTQNMSCWNYDGVYGGITCSDIENLSTSKANDWFIGTNSNGDSEFANIWGKLYTWLEASKTDGTGPCRNGYHLPSDSEFTILTNYITDQNGGDLNIGWAGHTTKTDTNNLVNALKLPLAGYYDTCGWAFFRRGHKTILWSSTTSGTSAYIRSFTRNSSTVNRINNGRADPFSVRCIKD